MRRHRALPFPDNSRTMPTLRPSYPGVVADRTQAAALDLRSGASGGVVTSNRLEHRHGASTVRARGPIWSSEEAKGDESLSAHQAIRGLHANGAGRC